MKTIFKIFLAMLFLLSTMSAAAKEGGGEGDSRNVVDHANEKAKIKSEEELFQKIGNKDNKDSKAIDESGESIIIEIEQEGKEIKETSMKMEEKKKQSKKESKEEKE